MLTKSQKLIYTFGGWMLAMLILLTLLNGISYESYFVLCISGLLVIVEISGPFTVKPEWRSRLNMAIAIGMIAFSMIVIAKVFQILGLPSSI